MACEIKFSAEKSISDPRNIAVTIVGQVKHVSNLTFDEVKSTLDPVVSQETWTSAVSMLSPSGSDTIALYLNRATLATLPSKCSRHNTPSRAHAITKIVKSYSTGSSETIIIVCESTDVFASGCAVARAFPIYSRKTSGGIDERSSATIARGHQVTVEFICVDKYQLTQNDLEVLQHSAYGIQLAARITDTPCNDMYTDKFIEEIVTVGESLGLGPPTIIQGERLKELGFGGIYGVGKAACHLPALVVLSHQPKQAEKTIAWVGKGIVYDTGGLSIKGKTAMPGMKRDCGGAAGILGAFYAAVKQGFNQNLHAVFCLAENAVSDRSTRPDDIHTLYSGKTVEINNTDAEGRLVVSDGVVYADRDLKADIIVDMCTLTGAQGVTTGKYHAAHLTNNEDWECFCQQAGRASGDLSFPIVYCPELHFQEFSSAVADMKNSIADRNNAVSSCAGLFIKANLGFDFSGVWLHIDMSSPVRSGERATGYGVALLNVLFGKYTNGNLLKTACPIDDAENGNEDVDSSSFSKRKKIKKTNI